jgi:hypothetical protein
MAKLSPRFVTYFIFASLALAFIFPITHSAYEGLANKNEENSDPEEEEEEEEEVKEGFDIISNVNEMFAKIGGKK